jgi:glucokinase
MKATHWIGVDLGGTKILAGLFNEHFHVLSRQKAHTEPSKGTEHILGTIRKLVKSILDEAGLTPEHVRGMGMCIPGQLDPQAQRVRFAPNLNWKDVDVGREIKGWWPFPTFMENDVRLGTYGEFTHGAARGARNVLGIFVGTGVGGGLILNGELYTGFNFNAGEIGHIVMHWRKGTTLEGLAGRLNLMRRAKELLADSPKRVRKEWKGVELEAVKSSELAEFYQKDDPIAVQLVDDAARAIGAAVGSCVNFLSPEVIVIGGGVAGALGESFLERVWEIAQRYTLPETTTGVRCVLASLQDDSGIYGAAAYAWSRLAAKSS